MFNNIGMYLCIMNLTKEQIEEHLVHYNASLKTAVDMGNDVLAAELRTHIKLLSLQYIDLGNEGA